MSIFEPEETIGRLWHYLIGASQTYRAHPHAAVRLEDMRARLGVLFRACGGAGGIRIAESAATASAHRLRLRQAVGLGVETLERPMLDASVLRLPAKIDVFPNAADNERLYEWLGAWFAHAITPVPDDDLLRDDIGRLRAAAQTTRATLAAWPGLGRIYARLRHAVLDARPRRALPTVEAAVEAAIVGLLNGEPGEPGSLLQIILDDKAVLDGLKAPPGYRTYLPAPVWGEILIERAGGGASDAAEPGGDGVQVDAQRRRAVRKSTDRSDRGDPLILHRFESIFSIADMINVNRSVEDDDEHSARQALKDTPELTIGAHSKRAATRLRLDLDLSPREAEAAPIAEHSYPEWDYRKQRYLASYCRVTAKPADETGEDWSPDPLTIRNIRRVRRQFEALRPRRQILRGEPDGDDLDLSMLVRDVAERRAGGPGTERIFTGARETARDLSLAVLMDVSLSTDAWLAGRRVLDVEKSALLAFTHGLTACGDEHAVYAFTSRRRSNVTVATVKGFDERLDGKIIRRIAALKPGQYTRIGAAVRHVGAELAKRPHRHRLLLLLTDGKPNDVDHYEGRYGVEDTRKAILEARQMGLRVFGVTIDENARDYFPHIFGRGAYAIVADVARLPAALPAIYRQITA